MQLEGGVLQSGVGGVAQIDGWSNRISQGLLHHRDVILRTIH